MAGLGKLLNWTIKLIKMSKRQINDAIQKLAGTFGNDHVSITPCTVFSIDQASRTCVCTPIGGRATTNIIGVHLMAEIDDGLLLIPVLGSTVIVCHSGNNTPFIILFSAIQKIILVGVSGLQFQGGELGGLVEVQPLTTKLNSLENLVNDLVSKFNSHTHILTLTTGTGTAAPTSTQETTVLTPTVRADIENTAITHGGL